MEDLPLNQGNAMQGTGGKSVLLMYEDQRFFKGIYNGLQNDKSGDFKFFVSKNKDNKTLYLFISKIGGISDDYSKEKYLFDRTYPKVVWKYIQMNLTFIINPKYANILSEIMKNKAPKSTKI